jgi:hypothetical protein
VLFKEVQKPGDDQIMIPARGSGSLEDLETNLFTNSNDNFGEKSFDSSFKSFSIFSNYTHQNQNQNQTQQQLPDLANVTSFGEDILDVTFRNGASMDFTLKSPNHTNKELRNYSSVADTLLSFKNSARLLENTDMEVDSNETVNLAFSSSPISKLNLRFHESRPVDDAFQFDKFSEFTDLHYNKYEENHDISNPDEEHTIGQCTADIENKENLNSLCKPSNLESHQNSSKSQLYDQKPTSSENLIPLKSGTHRNTRRILGLDFSSLSPSGLPQVEPRQSSIRFREKSRVNYNEETEESTSDIAREQRRELREAQRAKRSRFGSSGKPIRPAISGKIKDNCTAASTRRELKPRGRFPTAEGLLGARRKVPVISRSKNGCWTCRIRKKKCTEERPFCIQCGKLGITCDGYSDIKPDFVIDMTLQREKLNEIKAITSKRKKIAVKKNCPRSNEEDHEIRL